MRAASAMRPSPTGSGLTPRLGIEPETITVSDDDDEPPMSLVKRPPSEKVEEISSENKLKDISSEAKSTEPFVPYRELEPSTDVAVVASASTSFMPTFFSSKPEIKVEPEVSKSEVFKPEVESCRSSIKEEPKEDFNLEVGEDETTETFFDVEKVKKENCDLKMEEYADLLLSLADVFPQHVEDQQSKDEEENCFEQFDNGLDLLLEGIQLHLRDEKVIEQVYETCWSQCSLSVQGLEMLFEVAHQDMASFGIGDDLSVLCSVTESDYFGFLNWVDPMIELKSRFNLHNYKCETSQLTIKQFITKKIKKFKKLNENQGEGGHCLPAPDFESLDEVIKRIKNTDIMSQLEVELRSKLALLQDFYRDKQKEMSRLKSSPKKVASGSRSRTRGPGRPKKRCLKSSAKTKMGRPRKRRHSEEGLNEEVEDEEEEGDDDEGEEDETNLSPPVLQPWSTTSRSPSPPSLFHHLDSSKPSTSGTSSVSVGIGGLLKPPKLTASFSPQSSSSGVKKFGSASNSVTNLSMINARFMKGKANPFQNLMKLATVPSGPGNSKDDSSSSTDEDDPIGKEKLRESSAEQTVAKESAESGGDRKYSDPEDGSASKRRKCEKPRRHCGSTETIVHKQPKNLFMMNCMTLQRGFSEKTSKVDEYDFRENEDDDDDECDDAVDVEDRWGSKSKIFSQYRDSVQPATPPPTVPAALVRSKPAWSPSAITKPQQTPAPVSQPIQQQQLQQLPQQPQQPQQQQQQQLPQQSKAASPLVCLKQVEIINI